MKGSLWKFTYLFCATAGILAGYGISALIDGKENKPNINTKDNTLVREAGDSVFFDGEEVSPVPKQEFLSQEPAVDAVPSITQPPVSAIPSPTISDIRIFTNFVSLLGSVSTLYLSSPTFSLSTSPST